MIKACLFDFDGVIVDSEKYHHMGYLLVAKAIGAEFTFEEYAPFKSTGRKQIIPYLFKKAGKSMTEEEFKRYSRLRDETYDVALDQLNENDIMDGVIDYVKLLKRNGIMCAVVSSGKTSYNIAKRFGIANLFNVFIDGEANLPLKPNPDMYLLAAKLLGVQPSECVVFEDSINGVLSAKNAGMKCVGMQTYFTDKADKIIDSFVGADLNLLKF